MMPLHKILSVRDQEILERAKKILRIHCTAFEYQNGYPTLATPKAIIESLSELVALELLREDGSFNRKDEKKTVV